MKRVARILGALLAVIALGYFVLHAWDALAGQDLAQLMEPRLILTAGILTGLYMLLIPVTGLAWSWLLNALGSPTGAGLATTILATTQFGKYLPGNVAHHLGRVVVARSRGIGLTPTLASMAYETLLVLVACAHIAALTLLWSLPPELASWPMVQHRGSLVAAISLIAVVVLWAAPRLTRLVARTRGLDSEGRTMPHIYPGWNTLLGCYVLYMLNFILLGIGLFAVASALAPGTYGLSVLVLLMGAFAASWILGFLAPGAPAGLGVREAALALWLEGTLGASSSVVLIVVLRLATTAGDLLNFAWGALALKFYPESQDPAAMDFPTEPS